MIRGAFRSGRSIVRTNGHANLFRVHQAQIRGLALARMESGLSFGEKPRTSMNFKIDHRPGALDSVLRIFSDYQLNLTRIESRPNPFNADQFQLYVDFESQNEEKVKALKEKLSKECSDIQILTPKEVAWFPRDLAELDADLGGAQKTLQAAGELESDHPGFNDEVYRARRAMTVEKAYNYNLGTPIPRIEYTDEENETWREVFTELQKFYPKYACQEFNTIFAKMQNEISLNEKQIPQLEDISQFLQKETGFQLRPVSGLLSARQFLNSLAYRVFNCTQYIRHSSCPFYTPEPDIVHEIGHCMLLADPDFAELSQQIGLASLGATDADIERLATCYWFTVEFGLVREGDQVKAYGAGLLSSFGEMEYACDPNIEGDKPEILPWDPLVAAKTQYPITTYQPKYFVAESLKDAGDKLKVFSEEHVLRPFRVSYLPMTQTIHTDRTVKRLAQEE